MDAIGEWSYTVPEEDWAFHPRHDLSVVIERASEDATRLLWSVSCPAPEGATCRLGCGKDCGDEMYPCYDYDDDGEATRQHPLVDRECNVVPYMTMAGVGGGACIPDLFYGETGSPVTSGPIEVTFDGESAYIWRYAVSA